MAGGDRAGEVPPLPEPLPDGVTCTDSHCHLDIVDRPVGEVLAQASSVGMTRVVTIGTDLPSSRWAAATAAAYDGVRAAVAVHPDAAATVTDEDLRELEALAGRPEVRAVGETGLDHFHTTTTEGWALQELAFRAHIAIAKSAGVALVIHDRDAHDDVLRVLAEEGAPEHTVFHCFSGDVAMARLCADRGYVMSFAGNATFKNAGGLREAAAVVPAGQLLVETDAPFLTPVPWRGRPNAPALVPLTLRLLAEVRGVDVAALAADADATATRVFGP